MSTYTNRSIIFAAIFLSVFFYLSGSLNVSAATQKTAVTSQSQSTTDPLIAQINTAETKVLSYVPSPVRAFVTHFFSGIESWRLNISKGFITKRNSATDSLQKHATAKNTASSQGSSSLLLYSTLVLFSVLTFIFMIPLIFYAVCILLIYLLLRFIFRRILLLRHMK